MVKQFLYAAAFLTMLCAATPAAIAQLNANASFSPETVETGDTFSLRILVQGGKTAPTGVNFSPWQAWFPADNILNTYAWKRSGEQWVKRYTLIAFDSAELELPPLMVITHLGDSLPTNSLHLSVRPTAAIADAETMDTIRDIRHVAGINWADFWPLTVALAVLLIFWMWYIRRKKAPSPPLVPVYVEPVFETPPHTLALQQLEQLAAEKPWLKGHIQEFYTDIGHILRNYLEKAHKVPAPETTTRETVQLLQKANLPTGWINNIQTVLQRTDMVKYAHTEPDNTVHEKTLDTSFHIVQSLSGINSADLGTE